MINLVLLQSLIFNMVVDIRYATIHNFTNSILYPASAELYLTQEAAHALQGAAVEFEKLGYRLKIWDAYRPLSVQKRLWSVIPDERYVANPVQGSRHNRGCAVDLTLVDKDGCELDMGTEFDDFSLRAGRSYSDLPEQVIQNRSLLDSIMLRHGFEGMPTEWWHFDYQGWQNYPILDVSFEALAAGHK